MPPSDSVEKLLSAYPANVQEIAEAARFIVRNSQERRHSRGSWLLMFPWRKHLMLSS